MAKIVLSKYELSKVQDIETANLLSKIYTFVCNICYSSNEIRSKIARGVSESFFKQLILIPCFIPLSSIIIKRKLISGSLITSLQ